MPCSTALRRRVDGAAPRPRAPSVDRGGSATDDRRPAAQSGRAGPGGTATRHSGGAESGRRDAQSRRSAGRRTAVGTSNTPTSAYPARSTPPAPRSTSRSPPGVPCVSPAYPSMPSTRSVARRGSTVNDVVLAVTGGALRRYLLRRRALPTRRLCSPWCRCRHATAGSPTGGNHTVGTRHHTGHQRRRSGRTAVRGHARHERREAPPRRDRPRIARSDCIDLVPPRAGQGLARLAGRLRLARWGPRSFNVVVSNVPGPDARSTAMAPWWSRRIRWVRSPTGRRST